MNLSPRCYNRPETLIDYVFAPRESFNCHPNLDHSDCLLFITGVELRLGINTTVYAETHHRQSVICRLAWLDTYFEPVARLMPRPRKSS